ncbi:MAG: hypothetical protein SCALA702_21260 [Melioribacteraceae bacterium]|nr:MAG: hypothetical protein SCALA702_21260 [Melioribacteraceae bacterium]
MKRLYISILLATFQVIYYLGWVSYSNNSDIEIIDEFNTRDTRVLMVDYEEFEPAVLENYSYISPDSLSNNELKYQFVTTSNHFN